LNPITNNGNCQLVVGLIDTSVQPLNPNLSQFLQPPSTSPVTPKSGHPITTHRHGRDHHGALQQDRGNTPSKSFPSMSMAAARPPPPRRRQRHRPGVNHGADIINLSLGSTGDSQLLHNTINQVVQQGIPSMPPRQRTVTTPTYPPPIPESSPSPPPTPRPDRLLRQSRQLR